MKSKYDQVPLERQDKYGSLRLMAIADGYVMARRKGGSVFVVTVDEWCEIGAESRVVPLRPVS